MRRSLQLGEALLHQLLAHLEHLLATLDQIQARIVDMPLLRELVQHMQGPGPHTGRGVLLETELRRDPIGGKEADAPDIRCQAVGIVLDDPDGLPAVGLEDLGGVGGGDPVTLQKEHHLPDLLMFPPSPRDHLHALVPNPFHLGQPLRLLVQDAQGVLPEGIYDAAGHDRADSLDEP